MGCAFGKSPTRDGEEEGGATKAAAGEKPAPPPGRRRDVIRSYVPPPPGSSLQWPVWLTEVAGEAIHGLVPRRADSFQKLAKIGQGTYSNVYKARDMETGKIVALKKVRFDSLERESVKFMAREISLLRRLDHPNVIKLQGLIISRVSTSLYLIFDYLEHDLSGLLSSDVSFSFPQIKSFMKQLLSGLEHCHSQGVMHRDIKGANLLVNNDGVLKIADFGLALHRRLGDRRPMTSRVVTLWYRPPELLLGSTSYGFTVDLWSAGCVLAELLSGRPVLPGRTEVEQLHRIFKLCGSPEGDYWRKLRLPRAAAVFNTQQTYKRSIAESFRDFPPAAVSLIDTLLSLDPTDRGTATSALNSDFFRESPQACEPMSLAHYPPTKELDAKMREEMARGSGNKEKGVGAGPRKARQQNRRRARPAPEANAELQTNIDRRRLIAQMTAKSKSEKFPPPHRDGAASIRPDEDQPGNRHLSFIARPDRSLQSSVFDPKNLPDCAFPRAAKVTDGAAGPPKTRRPPPPPPPMRGPHRRRCKSVKTDSQVAPAQIYGLTELVKSSERVHGRFKGKEIEVSG